MSLRPILRPYVAKEVPVESAGTAKAAGNPFLVDPIEDISSVIKAITDAGGAAVSLDLALDLVLNEFVEQAREATRATGAAIALVRDGEMICRATSGNAPELGTRVETTVGLSGAALLTGTVQRCVDTEKDPRVDGEACRQLQLRSMVLVPIADSGPPFGILEVFSSSPDNFSDEDVERLRQLAAKVVESKKETERPIHQPPAETESGVRPANEGSGIPETSEAGNEIRENLESATAPAGLEQPVKNEILTSALVVLVIAAAVLLGVVIGVRQTVRPEAKTPEHAASVSSSAPQPGGAPATTPARQSAEPSAPPVRQPQRLEPPVGGLIVTENGKVIYRSDASAGASAGHSAEALGARVVHRVDPEYPEAAREQGIEGPVVLDAKVLPDGTVGDITVVQGHPVLAQAATQAVKQWKFQPYTEHGQPANRQERITVKFSLPSS